MLKTTLKIPTIKGSDNFTYLLGSLDELKAGMGIVLVGGHEEAMDELYVGGVIGVYQKESTPTVFNLGFHPNLIHIAGVDDKFRGVTDWRIAISPKNFLLPEFNKKESLLENYDFLNTDSSNTSLNKTYKNLLEQRLVYGLTFEEESIYQACNNRSEN